MIPLSSKSLAARLNISKDKGPVFMSFEFNFGDESNREGIFIVVEGFWQPFEVVEPVQEVELVHPVEFVIVWKQWQV